ncbi:unnamed protein product [Blepharisma stoltei]|uniref:EGF-like domain-containing protein n=1 Tax=Blepharisma stoltei TaxID=1481888 RepID=A0AAU9IYM6_9CILI|nr:unnamed protein product [Blepharisma stoltei]
MPLSLFILSIVISESSSISRDLQVTCPASAVCTTCMSSSSNTWFGCTGCPSGLYLYEDLCWNACPVGTSQDATNGVCNIGNFNPIWFDFDNSNTPDSWGLVLDWDSPCANGPSYDSEYASFYFQKCSRMKYDTLLPYYYVISAWIYLNRINSSWLQIFSWNSESVYIKDNYLGFNQLVTETTSFPTIAWTYFWVSKKFDGTYLTFSVSMNANNPISATTSWGSDYYLHDSTSTLYLGTPPSSENKEGFTGFMYDFVVTSGYDDSYLNMDWTTWCDSSCSACPAQGNCLTGYGCGNLNCEYCENQDNNKWFGCTSCTGSKFLYQGMCYSMCPSGTSEDSTLKVCTKTSSYAVYLPMSETMSTSPYGWNLATDDSSSKPPTPVLNKGYFFDIYSYMEANVQLPVWTVISGWFYFDILSSPWYIFSIQNGGNYFLLNLDFQYPVYQTAENNNILVQWDEWVYIYASQSTDNFLAYFTVTINNEAAFTTVLPVYDVSGYYVYDSFDLFIGRFPSSLGGIYEGFRGFLYDFIIWSGYSASYLKADYKTSGCKGDCSACPSGNVCPSVDCGINYNQYRAISETCHSCFFASCTEACVRGTDCILCIDNCLSCSSFSICSTCKTGYLLGPTSTSCLKQCPAGSSDNGSSQCVFDSNSGYIFSFTFDQIKGLVSDGVHGTNVMAGTSNSFYPNYSDDSPKAVKNRGYYFNGQSLMQFPLGVSVMFNSDFSLSSWLYAPNTQTGVIVSKQVLDPDVIMKFEINSDKKPQLILYLTLGAETTTTSPIISDSPIDGTQWYNLAFSVSYSTPYSSVTFYKNGVASSTKLTRGAFIDLISDYSITIGAQRSMSNFFNFFNGYLYSLKSWNIANNPTTIDVSYCSCGICPSTTVGCLPNQGISKYWDGSGWVNCKSECSNIGCVRDDTVCNLCESQSCFLCDDWTGCLIWCDPSCLTCVGPSSSECVLCADGSRILGSSYGSCVCTATNQYVKYEDPFTCENCHSSCASCIGPNYDDCLLCANEEITINEYHGYCECQSNQYLAQKSPIECEDCDPSCLTCSGPGMYSCTSCDSGLILNEDGHCSCGFAALENFQCTDCSDPSCQACLSTPENCISCFPPKILQGNICVCPLGMKELYGACISSDISVDEKYSNKVVYLTFSENLSEVLTESDLNLTIVDNYQAATFFELEFISLSSYQISVSFNPSNLDKGTLQVYITSPKYGISGSAIQQRLFTHNISSSNDDSKTAENFVANIFPRTFQTILTSLLLLYGGVSYIMFRKSTTLWTYVNTVQIIAFIPLQNIQIPTDLYNMFKGFISYTWIPNLGAMIYGRSEVGNMPLSRFSTYGYKSGLFFISAGGMIFLSLVFLTIWNIIWIVHEFIPNQKVKILLSDKVLVNFKYNWLIRLLVEIYILAFCGIVIGMNNYNGNDPDFVLDFIIAWILFILSLAMNALIFLILRNNKENIVLKNEKFYKKFSTLVEVFHCEKGILSMCYFPIFFIRRTVYVISLYNLYDWPLIQSIFNACCSLLTLIFLIKFRPYKDNFDNKAEISSEVLVTILFIVVIPFIDTKLSVSARETCQIIATSATLIFLLYSYYLLILKLIRKIKNRKTAEINTREGIAVPNNSKGELSSEGCELEGFGLK